MVSLAQRLRLSSGNRFVFPLAVFLAGAGALALLIATRWGAGASPDSAVYIGAARSLLAGQGLSLPFGESAGAPLTHHAPLYPLLLALPGLFGVDPLESARWWSVLLFGANLLLVGAVLHASFPRSTWLPLLGVFFGLTAIPLLKVHSMAWTEPLFLFLGLSGLFLLSKYLAAGKRGDLIASAVLIGLAFLTRYSGAALALACGIGLLLWGPGQWKTRLVNLALFGILSGLPIGLWLLRNLWVASTATNREFAFHLLSTSKLWEGLFTLSSWILIPATAPNALKCLPWLVLFAGGLAVIVLKWREKATTPAPEIPAEAPGGLYFMGILIVYLVAYAFFLAASISFFDANTPLDDRILAPVYLPLLILVLWIGRVLSERSGKWLPLKVLGAGVTVALAAAYLFHGAGFLGDLYSQGSGYTGLRWSRSQTLEYVRQLPPGRLLYSNLPEAVYLLTGHSALLLPKKFESMVQEENPAYAAEMEQMIGRIQNEDGWVVYLLSVERWTLPTEQELLEQTPLSIIYQAEDGKVFGNLIK